MSDLDHYHILLKNTEYARRNVIEFEKLMKRAPQVEIPIDHYFAKGIYGRVMTVPKGVILTGKIHKHDHICILLKGKVEVLIDDIVVEIEAPFVYHSKAGIKRIIRVLEDCQWMNIHSNPNDAISESVSDKGIEDYFVVDTEEEYKKFLEQEPELPLIGSEQ